LIDRAKGIFDAALKYVRGEFLERIGIILIRCVYQTRLYRRSYVRSCGGPGGAPDAN